MDAIDSPRVNRDSRKKEGDAPAARVPPVTISDARGRYKVGTVISKKFDGIFYKGTVIKPYNGRHYLIEYEDGDKEHMTHTEVKNHLPRIQYTGGYAVVLESILTKNASLNVIALDNLREAQNVAFAVTHPLTGKQMEYKDLIKNPEYRETGFY